MWITEPMQDYIMIEVNNYKLYLEKDKNENYYLDIVSGSNVVGCFNTKTLDVETAKKLALDYFANWIKRGIEKDQAAYLKVQKIKIQS